MQMSIWDSVNFNLTEPFVLDLEFMRQQGHASILPAQFSLWDTVNFDGTLTLRSIPVQSLFEVSASDKIFLQTGDVIDARSWPVRRAIGDYDRPWHTMPVESLFAVGSTPINLSTSDVVQIDLSGFVTDFHEALRFAFEETAPSERIPLDQVIDFESPDVVDRLVTAIEDRLRDRPDLAF